MEPTKTRSAENPGTDRGVHAAQKTRLGTLWSVPGGKYSMLTPVGISVTRVTSKRRRISAASVWETATMWPEAWLTRRS